MRNFEIEHFKIENNLNVLVINTKTFPSFTALLLVRAGSRYESKRENGLAHFFEHMAFKGSKKYPDALKLASKIEGIGAEFNAFTDRTHTGYWIKAPVRHFSLVIDVLSDMIKNPLLKEEEIEREKKVVIEEINMYEDMPQYKVIREFVKLVFGNHPLGRPILGPKENLLRFKREDVLKFLKKYYYPSRAFLILAGGFEEKEKLRLQVEKKFSDWIDKKMRVSFVKFKSKGKKRREKIIKKDTQQAHLVVGFEGLSLYDEGRYSLSVAEAILGGGMSSRLFWQLRERRGWCYYVSTSSSFYEETGIFYTRAGIVAEREKIEETVKVILSEYERIALGKFKESEMKRAKEYIKGGYLLSLEDSFNLASSIGRKYMFFGKVVQPQKVIEKIDTISKEDIQKVFSGLFRKKALSIAVVSPFESFRFVEK